MEKRDLFRFSAMNDSIGSFYYRISSRSRIIYWIITGMVITAIAILPFVYVDISIQARGFFQPSIEKQVIYSPVSGRVLFSALHTGRRISRGDTLLITDHESVAAQKQLLLKRTAENDGSVSDLRFLISFDPSKGSPKAGGYPVTRRYASELDHFRKQHEIQFQKLKKAERDFERNTLLHRQELIPDVDYENTQYLYRAEAEALNQVVLSQKAVWQADLSNRLNDSVRLKAEMSRADEEMRNRILISPVDGEIIKSAEIQHNGFVSFSQFLAEISPSGSLLAACYVKPSDIGMVYEDQPVLIQVDAFSYNEWGMLKGWISDISDDMITEGSGQAYFRVRCVLEKSSLSLKNGRKAEMKKGMSFTARMLVARRSLFNLLFDKADKWLNPYLINQNQGTDADKS